MGDKGSGGGGGNNNGGGSGNGGGPSTSQPTAPSNNFVASTNVASGSSQSGSVAQPQGIIAVPVQVDASAFLNKTSPAPDAGMVHLPTTEVASKAKERANKYLFDAQADVADASDKLEELKEIRDQQKADKADRDAKDHKDDK